jgi:serine/threonine protein kinase
VRQENVLPSDPFGLVGSTIGNRYAVEAVVGEGGFSVVYRARHTLWNRPVAIKAFRCADSAPEAHDRMLRAFVQEGAMLAELSERTTAIVQARDVSTLISPSGDWVPYLVLEWLDGETLEGVLWQERRALLPVRTLEQAVMLLEPIARALALAHAKGICHRDLKPGNVFVLGNARGGDCTTKLLDFGVATFFAESSPPLSSRRRPMEPCGFTPSYGAPEQVSAAFGVTGPWTDVFALALILVELVTGRDPLGPGSAEDLARSATDPARRPTPWSLGAKVPAAVERVLARALAVHPAERWQTAAAFWQALRAALTASSTPSRPMRRPAPAAVPVAVGLAFTIALATSAVLAMSAVSDMNTAPVPPVAHVAAPTALR